jgi:hypothetical protein
MIFRHIGKQGRATDDGFLSHRFPDLLEWALQGQILTFAVAGLKFPNLNDSSEIPEAQNP